ncbi:MAG: beta-ureidopropionase [Armatimonadetes bacterium]|nr:beta-ureidopropionase [Armatimonadota bacterium]
MAPAKGDYRGNVARVAEAIVTAAGEGADLVVFPEASLTGYFLEGGVGDVAVPVAQVVSDIEEQLAGKLDRPVDAVIGFFERSDGNIYNAAAYIEFGPGKARLVHVHHKFFLPTYGVFDEERFVSRGRDVSAYDTRFGRFAMLICEDVWHSITPTIAALKGALVIVAIAASPARDFSGDEIGNLATYHKLMTGISQEHGVWTVNAMLVGFEGGKGFVGGSIIADPYGNIVAKGPVGEEFILVSEVDMDLIGIVRERSPMLADLVSVLEDVTREIDDVNEATCP